MNLDEETAQRLAMNPIQVSQVREKWNAMPEDSVIRTMFAIKLQNAKDDVMKALALCEPDDVKKLQGRLIALNLAETILTQPLKI